MKCRSLGPRSPLDGQLWGLRSNWRPLGMLLRVQWSNEKEAQAESIFPFFFSLLLLHFPCFVHLYSVFTVEEGTDRAPSSLFTLLSISLWLHPVYLCPITLSWNNNALPPLSFVIFSSWRCFFRLIFLTCLLIKPYRLFISLVVSIKPSLFIYILFLVPCSYYLFSPANVTQDSSIMSAAISSPLDEHNSMFL